MFNNFFNTAHRLPVTGLLALFFLASSIGISAGQQANPDVIFSIQVPPGSFHSGSTAWQGGVGAAINPNADLLPDWVGSSGVFHTNASSASNISSMNLEADSFGYHGTFTAKLESVMNSNEGLFIGSQSLFGLGAWVRGDGYVPYRIELVQNGSVSNSWDATDIFSGAGLSAASGIYSGHNLQLNIASSGWSGSNNRYTPEIASYNGSVNGDGATTIFNGEVYQRVWFQPVNCWTDGMVYRCDGHVEATANLSFMLTVSRGELPKPACLLAWKCDYKIPAVGDKISLSLMYDTTRYTIVDTSWELGLGGMFQHGTIVREGNNGAEYTYTPRVTVHGVRAQTFEYNLVGISPATVLAVSDDES